MVKKFLSVILLAVGIALGSQFADVSTANAADVYAYTEGGVEYYVTGGVLGGSPFSGDFGAYVKGVSGGKVVKELFFVFGNRNGQWIYQIRQGRVGATIERGYLSDSGKAQTVYNVTKKNF